MELGAAQLAAFAGEWTVERRIADALGGRPGRFAGRARFEPDGDDGMIYDEEGVLSLGEGPGFAAARRYLWRADPKGIAVSFADGRFFHRIAAGVVRPQAVHDCPPDVYAGIYDFAGWPVWRVEWRVLGPRKDYGISTVFRREILGSDRAT